MKIKVTSNLGNPIEIDHEKITIFRNPARKFGPYLFEEFLVGYWKPIENGKETWCGLKESKEELETILAQAQ